MPYSYQSKQNQAHIRTLKIQANPTHGSEQMNHPVKEWEEKGGEGLIIFPFKSLPLLYSRDVSEI